MLIDLSEATFPPDDECYDFVIVGAGAVGIYLAAKLSRQGYKIALLESGGKRPEGNSQELNQAICDGVPHRGISEGRARLLGGTTSLWGGQLTPFYPIDIERRDWVLDGQWPLTFDEIAEEYSEVISTLGLPAISDVNSVPWERIGSRRPDLSPNFDIVLTRWLRETNFSELFSADLEKARNLKVYLHSQVLRVETRPADEGAPFVEAQSPAGVRFKFRSKKLVISCGTIESVRLMLASARLNPALPWAENHWVGKAFQDHLDYRAARIVPLDKEEFHKAFDNIYTGGFKYSPKLRLKEEVQRSEHLLNIGASIIFESSLAEHLDHLKSFAKALLRGARPKDLTQLPKHLVALWKLWFPLIRRYVKDRRAFNVADRGIFLNLHCEQRPLSESLISLDEFERDRFGTPFARLTWKVHGSEVATMKRFCELLDEALQKRRLGKLLITPELERKDKSVLNGCSDTNHQCGGLRMSNTLAEGVVDRNLRVHGTENLYIAGASVFPTSSFANPTFTALALASRLVRHICSEENGKN